MDNFQTSLLREKFILKNQDKGQSVTALSNRLVLTLAQGEFDFKETYIVRAYNMHSCIRMGARILQEYIKLGPIEHRPVPVDWNEMHNMIVHDYERKHVPHHWVAVYLNGQGIFKIGQPHPLLDIIEKTTVQNPESYELALPSIEKAFLKSGENIKINHEGHYALTTQFSGNTGRCNIMLRSSTQNKIFSFSVSALPERELNYAQTLFTGAAFLEGLQMAHSIARWKAAEDTLSADESQRLREANQRLARLNAEILNYERQVNVRYRPEKPDFFEIAES